jgi:hypothetical protein
VLKLGGGELAITRLSPTLDSDLSDSDSDSDSVFGIGPSASVLGDYLGVVVPYLTPRRYS